MFLERPIHLALNFPEFVYSTLNFEVRVSNLRRLAADPFEDLFDVLRILPAEVLEGKRIGCTEVAAELDPVFRFQRTIDFEDLPRSGLDMCRVLHRHIEVAIPPLKIFFFREKLDRAVAVPETVSREIELGVQVAGGEVVLPFNLDPNVLRLHFQGLERLDAIRLAPLDVKTVRASEKERDMPRLEIQGRAHLCDSGFDVSYVLVKGSAVPGVCLEIAQPVDIDPDPVLVEGNVFFYAGAVESPEQVYKPRGPVVDWVHSAPVTGVGHQYKVGPGKASFVIGVGWKSACDGVERQQSVALGPYRSQ